MRVAWLSRNHSMLLSGISASGLWPRCHVWYCTFAVNVPFFIFQCPWQIGADNQFGRDFNHPNPSRQGTIVSRCSSLSSGCTNLTFWLLRLPFTCVLFPVGAFWSSLMRIVSGYRMCSGQSVCIFPRGKNRQETDDSDRGFCHAHRHSTCYLTPFFHSWCSTRFPGFRQFWQARQLLHS